MNTPSHSPDQRVQSEVDFEDKHYSSYVSAADSVHLLAATKNRVNKVDRKQGHCIVTNTPKFICVQYAHLLPQAAKPKLLEKLEYSWGLRYGSLNLDTRYNVMRLHVYLHYLFDHDYWILLPEEQIVKDLTDITRLKDRKARNAGFQDFFKERKTYTYKLVPAEKMRSIPIFQYSDALTEETTATPDNFKLFCSPFDELPSITSHVRPHFAISDLGLKNLKGFIIDCGDEIMGRFAVATQLFNLWTKDIPERARDSFRSDHPPPKDDDDHGDNDSNATKEGPVDRVGFHRHNRQCHAADTSVSRKRQRTDYDGAWLDDKTLRKLDDYTSPKKRFKRKMKSVSDWVSSTSEVQHNPDIAV